jgi:muramoyltetrapeptide carboxypeptidase
VVRVVAPSGPFPAPLVWRALGWLSERYRVRFDRGIFAQDGYLAGSDARRRAELEAALSEPGVAAVLCARGGYGASRFVHDVDWSLLAASPRWICGFSDVTALHVEAAGAGVASIHSCNLTALGQGDASLRERYRAQLEAPCAARRFEGLSGSGGIARGPLYGGNLALLHACAAAGRLRVPPGAVLFVEDVGEQPYRLDRMLTTLIVGGHLSSVSGVVIGELTDCGPGRDGRDAHAVVREVLAPLAVPIAAGLPLGHGLLNEPVVLGAPAMLDADAGVLALF